MKEFLCFLRRVRKDTSKYYHQENELLQESVCLGIIGVVFLVLLMTFWGRWLIKWIAYISMGFAVVAVIAFLYGNYHILKKSYKYDKKLEKLGTTREEEEKNCERLCDLEDDDALPPQEKVVYFADASALAYYANALYGCFLVQNFKPQYMQLPEGAEIYTTQLELIKLRKLECEKTAPNAPYEGYASFIRANVHVLPGVNHTNEDELINTLLRFMLDLEPNISVAIVSTNETLAKMASEYTFEVINPLSGVTSEVKEEVVHKC